jgi:hypothetical protein
VKINAKKSKICLKSNEIGLSDGLNEPAGGSWKLADGINEPEV